MKYSVYKATCEIASSLRTPFHSDTLAGMFFWYYRLSYGEDALTALIDAWKEDAPEAVFSNGFVGDTFTPAFPPFSSAKLSALTDELAKCDGRAKHVVVTDLKKTKKRLSFSLEHDILRRQAVDSFDALLEAKTKEVYDQLSDTPVRSSRMELVSHNTINRVTGTVMQEGGLYALPETFYPQNATVVFYCKCTETIGGAPADAVLEGFFTYLTQKGFGADTSVGKGQLRLRSFERIDVPAFKPTEETNTIISLSNGVPCESVLNGTYKTFVKYGRLGDVYSVSGMSPFKKPITLMEAGGVFRVKEVKPFYGKMLANVHRTDERIVTSAYLLPVYIAVKDEGGAK